MNISARVTNRRGEHTVSLRTGAREHSLTIPPKQEGAGSNVNGGELLFLALATCYCNDIYREAAKRKIEVQRVEVEVTGTLAARAKERGRFGIGHPWMPKRQGSRCSR